MFGDDNLFAIGGWFKFVFLNGCCYGIPDISLYYNTSMVMVNGFKNCTETPRVMDWDLQTSNVKWHVASFSFISFSSLFEQFMWTCSWQLSLYTLPHSSLSVFTLYRCAPSFFPHHPSIRSRLRSSMRSDGFFKGDRKRVAPWCSWSSHSRMSEGSPRWFLETSQSHWSVAHRGC